MSNVKKNGIALLIVGLALINGVKSDAVHAEEQGFRNKYVIIVMAPAIALVIGTLITGAARTPDPAQKTEDSQRYIPSGFAQIDAQLQKLNEASADTRAPVRHTDNSGMSQPIW